MWRTIWLFSLVFLPPPSLFLISSQPFFLFLRVFLSFSLPLPFFFLLTSHSVYKDAPKQTFRKPFQVSINAAHLFYYSQPISTMQSRTLLILCCIAITLLVATSSAMVADEQYYPRARKVSNGAWLLAHHVQPVGKRGRFVFRSANAQLHPFDSINDDASNHDDGQEANFDLDKRNWRL